MTTTSDKLMIVSFFGSNIVYNTLFAHSSLQNSVLPKEKMYEETLDNDTYNVTVESPNFNKLVVPLHFLSRPFPSEVEVLINLLIELLKVSSASREKSRVEK